LWIIGVVIVIVVTLVLLFVAAVLYAQREHTKLNKEKERMRLLKIEKMEWWKERLSSKYGTRGDDKGSGRTRKRRSLKRSRKGISKIGHEEDNIAVDDKGLLSGNLLGEEGAPNDNNNAAYPAATKLVGKQQDESKIEVNG